MYARLKRKLGSRRVTEDEDGTATVEFVLWVPVFFLILALVVDASMIFLSHANMWSVARDATRRISVREMTGAEAQTYVADKLGFLSGAVVVTIDDVGPDVSVNIAAPISEMDMFGILGFVSSQNLNARVTQSLEPM